jgi:hypothetical protein
MGKTADFCDLIGRERATVVHDPITIVVELVTTVFFDWIEVGFADEFSGFGITDLAPIATDALFVGAAALSDFLYIVDTTVAVVVFVVAELFFRQNFASTLAPFGVFADLHTVATGTDSTNTGASLKAISFERLALGIFVHFAVTIAVDPVTVLF